MGRVMVKLVPFPICDWTVSEPPCASAILPLHRVPGRGRCQPRADCGRRGQGARGQRASRATEKSYDLAML